jgi:hypothetical protein
VMLCYAEKVKKIAKILMSFGVIVGVGALPTGFVFLAVASTFLESEVEIGLSWVVFYYAMLAMLYVALPAFVVGALLFLSFWTGSKAKMSGTEIEHQNSR